MWLYIYIYMYIKLSNTCVSMWFFEQTRCLAQVPLMQQKRFPSWWKLKINLESSGWYHLMGFSNTFPNSGKWSIPILRSSPWLDPICPFVMMCHDVSRFQLPLMLSGSTPGFICGSGAPTRGRKGEMVRMKHMRFEPAWRPQIPAWRHQALELYCKCSLQQLHAEQQSGMEETIQKYHETNLSLDQPYLDVEPTTQDDQKSSNMLAKHSHREPSIQESENHSDSINFNRNHWDPSRTATLSAPCFAWCARICTWCPPEQSGWHVIGHVDRVHKLLGIVSKLIWFMSCYMGLFQETMQWLVCDRMCENFVISASLQSASCSKMLVHQMAFPVVPRWWKGRIENMDMLEGNIPRQFDLLREGNDKQSGHNSTHLHRKRNTLPSLWGSSSFDRGPSSPSYISAFPVFHWTCLASQLWELFSSLSLRKMSKHWPEHTHGLLNVSEPMAFVRYGPVKKSNT